MAVYVILAVVLLLFVVLMFVPIRVTFSLSRYENANKTEFFISYLFFKYKPKEKQRAEYKTDKEKQDKSAPERGIRYFKNIYKAIKDDLYRLIKFLKVRAVRVEKIDLKVDFGYSDAAATGIMTGIINAGAYNAVSLLCNNLRVDLWNVDITPDFDNEKFDASFFCILRIKPAHITMVGIKALKMLIKIRKAEKKGRG